MSGDPRDQNWTTDSSGRTWLIDSTGEYVRDHTGERLPGPPREIPDPISGFTTYDSSRGHCGFCGRLTCGGQCFR
jgi:hypothetical protein